MALLGVLFAGCPVLMGCGSNGSRERAKTPAAAEQSLTVPISGYAFHPGELTVGAGSRVTFVNRDSTPHTATATGQAPAFDTGTLQQGQRKTITLTKPGTYSYYCQFHAFMHGTITVR